MDYLGIAIYFSFPVYDDISKEQLKEVIVTKVTKVHKTFLGLDGKDFEFYFNKKDFRFLVEFPTCLSEKILKSEEDIKELFGGVKKLDKLEVYGFDKLEYGNEMSFGTPTIANAMSRIAESDRRKDYVKF
jgi:hypothetical protein